MNQLSKKRLREIASGSVKLNHGSTIKQMSVEKFRELRDKGNKALLAALRGDGGEMSSSVVDRVFGKVKRKRSDRQIAKDRAWDQFSLFIRLRDSDEFGRAKCCTCGKRRYWREMDAGHYVTTAKEATKFDENNVHAQCKGCNKWQGGKPVEYEQFIERKYGHGTALAIRTKSVQECKRHISVYPIIEAKYKEKAAELAKAFPGKFKTS